MNNYGEFSIMTWRRISCKHSLFVKTGSLKGKLHSNGASATQNCLGNKTACIWEYRTNVNGTVSSPMFFPVSILKQSERFEV